MKQRRRSRVLAVGIIVASAVVATVVVAGPPDITIIDPAPISRGTPFNGSATMLTTVRNVTSGPLTVSAITLGGNCGGVILQGIEPLRTPPFTLQANEAQQLSFTFPGFGSATLRPCDYTVVTSVGMTTATVTNNVVASAPNIDAEPLALDYGSHPINEVEKQRISIANYHASVLVAHAKLTGDVNNFFTITGDGAVACDTIGFAAVDCTTPPINPGAATTVSVTCKPTAIAGASATLVVDDKQGTVQNVSLSCAGVAGSTPSNIAFQETSLAITGGLNQLHGATGHVVFSGTGSGTNSVVTTDLAAAVGIKFTDVVHCTNTHCSYPPQTNTLPAPVGIACTPTDTTTRSTTLTATGENAFDVASIPVTCQGTNTSATLTVSATDVSVVPSTPVSSTGHDTSLFIGNSPTAGVTLTGVTQSFTGTAAGDWTASPCLSPMTCSFPVGMTQGVTLSFTPTTFGDRSAQLLVQSANGGQQTVTVHGTGLGSRLVQQKPLPPNHTVDFGSIAKNQTAHQSVEIAADGNATVHADLAFAPANAAFGLGATQLAIPQGSFAPGDVTCQSATAGTFSTKLNVSSTDAFGGAPFQLDVTCIVADTDALLDPASLDFGENRHGNPPADTRPVMVVNPLSGGSVTVTAASLSSASGHVSVSPKMPLPFTINAMSSLELDVKLDVAASNADEDFDTAGLTLDVVVDGETLSMPIHGRVVTAATAIAPSDIIDLGTVCIGGSPQPGSVVLTNTGTATVSIQQPVMDVAFTAQYSGSTTLSPGAQAVASVVPSATQSAGSATGMLTWADDVPNTYEVPVSIQFVADGGAASPSMLAFANTPIATASTAPMSFTLQNCDPTPRTVNVGEIAATAGDAKAWSMSPPAGSYDLGPTERKTFMVSFAPAKVGHFDASVGIDFGDSTQSVDFTGDGIDDGSGSGSGLGHGGDDGHLGETSFYACGCSTPGVPAQGWPVAAALGFVLLIGPGGRGRGARSARRRARDRATPDDPR